MKRLPLYIYILLTAMIALVTTAYSRVHAESYVNPTTEFFNQGVDKGDKGGLNMESTIQSANAGNFISQTNLLIGTCGEGPGCVYSYEKSALAGLGNTIIAMYNNPPASTYAFIVDTGKTLGFLPRTYAQGVGFSGLSAMLPLWKAFRDIAYALLAVIMIIVGFMVMFRKKIDPKTVVTVQSAIPRIVVALILVTFSYAIVGIMIDIMYLSIVFIASILGNATSSISGGEVNSAEFLQGAFGGGIGSFVAQFVKSGWAFSDIADFLTGNNSLIQGGAVAVSGVIGFLLGGGKGLVAGVAALPVALGLILAIILLFGVIRLIFMLVDAYINIIISLLLSPLQLMAEAIPGTSAFSSWFRHLVSKLVVFPLTAGLLMIASILTQENVTGGVWAPPFLSGGGQAFGLAGIIGLGMLLSIPTIVGGIQKALKAEPMVPGGLGPIVGPLGAGVGQLMGLVYQTSFISSAIRHKPDARSPIQVAREAGSKGIGGILDGGGGH